MDKVCKQCAYYAAKEFKNLTWLKKFLLNCNIRIRQNIFHKFEIPYIEMFITTKCNLRCRDCSNLIPLLCDQKNIGYERIINDINTLLSKVDRLYRLKLHGGEVLLHPDLPKIIRFCDTQRKIVSIRITTNGTIIPSQEIISALKGSKVVVQISDYHLPQCKISELIALFERNDIKYAYLKDQKWRDMGDFSKRNESRFNNCSISRCTSLFDGKIFVCSRMAIASALGLVNGIEFISINQCEKVFRKQMEFFYAKDDMTACSYCDGDTKYAKTVTAGMQEARK